MSIAIEVSRGAIIAREVWNFIQSQQSVKLVPWAIDPDSPSYYSGTIEEWKGHQKAFRQIEEFMIEKAEELKEETDEWKKDNRTETKNLNELGESK